MLGFVGDEQGDATLGTNGLGAPFVNEWPSEIRLLFLPPNILASVTRQVGEEGEDAGRRRRGTIDGEVVYLVVRFARLEGVHSREGVSLSVSTTTVIHFGAIGEFGLLTLLLVVTRTGRNQR